MKKVITTILCSVLVSLCTIPLHGAVQQDRPNILFILVDDMGWRDLACYGHKIHETPNIDQLAAQGMRFTNAYAACPICAPSRAAIMTGKLPSNTGFVDNYASQLSGKTLQRSKERQFLKLQEVTLAEALKAGGYQTAFLGKWHLSKGIRVPCIVDWPGVTRRGSVSDTPVHGVDFSATLLAMTGLPQQPEHHEDSVNLVPLLKGDTDFKRGPLVWHYPVGVPHIAHSKPGSVIRAGDWKFLRFYEDGREELYNLKDDIGETNNLARSMPEKAAELKAQLDAVLKAHNATIPTDVPAKPKRPVRKKAAKKVRR
jgi:arylsulfatase A-like enzyme